MKALLFILLATATYAQSSNYARINGDGTVIEVMVSDPVNAATYPAAGLQAFPDAVKCVPTMLAWAGITILRLTRLQLLLRKQQWM